MSILPVVSPLLAQASRQVCAPLLYVPHEHMPNPLPTISGEGRREKVTSVSQLPHSHLDIKLLVAKVIGVLIFNMLDKINLKSYYKVAPV